MLCPHFLVSQDIYEKNICAESPSKYHNRDIFTTFYVYIINLAVSEGLFLSSFCLYMSHVRWHSRTFLPLSLVYMSTPPYSLGDHFSTFIIYMSRLILSQQVLSRT